MLKTLKKTQDNKFKISDELCEPLQNSKKTYIKSNKFRNLSVPMREIKIEDEDQKSVIVYDTSGLYTDKTEHKDLSIGLKPIREPWLKLRNNIGIEKKHPLKYLNKKNSQGLVFPNTKKKILKAKNNTQVSQMYYAKLGEITEEMEFCAIRENEGIE